MNRGMASSVLVCLPVYNEAPIIRYVLDDLFSLLDELPFCRALIVDDCSSDGTEKILEQLEHPRVTVYKHDFRMGVGDCLLDGLTFARSTGAYHFVFWPGNFRIRRHSVSAMIRYGLSVKISYLHGSRFSDPGIETNTPFHRLALIRMLSWFASLSSRRILTDVTCGLRFVQMKDIELFNLENLRGSRYAGEQLLTTRCIKSRIDIEEFPVRLNYSRARMYSHVGVGGLWDIVKPWAILFVSACPSPIELCRKLGDGA